METARSRVTGRLAGVRGQKFAVRREELAAQATGGLAELGVARASMRELAQYCDISLGVLHYYFDDKNDLVMCCVEQYKARFVDRYSAIVIEGESGPDLKARIGPALTVTLRESPLLHRLWFDLRNQAMFDARYAERVAEIDASLAALAWRAATVYARLMSTSVTVPPAVVYAAADSVFQRCLRELFAGDTDAPCRLSIEIQGLLDEFAGECSVASTNAE